MGFISHANPNTIIFLKEGISETLVLLREHTQCVQKPHTPSLFICLKWEMIEHILHSSAFRWKAALL